MSDSLQQHEPGTLIDEAADLPPPRGPWKMLWYRFRKNRLAMLGASILIVLYLLSCFGGFIAPYRVNEINKYTVKYGPMLLGGYSIEKIDELIGEDENLDPVVVNTYTRNWNWF